MDKGLVSFDRSLLFFLFFFLLHLLECFAGQSSKRGTFFFFFAEEIIIFSPIQKETQLFYFLFNFWMIFAPVSLPWYCKGRDRSSRGLLPPSACCILSFLCLSHKIMSSFSICQVPVQSGLLLISLPTHFWLDALFGHSWRGTECKPEHTRSQECNCLSSGRKSTSQPFGPCTFFPPKRSTLALGPGAWEDRSPETPPALWSLRRTSAHLAWLKHSP